MNPAPLQHHFIVTIPVADRPRQLQTCLDSLLTLCHTYHQQEIEHGRYPKLSVLVIEDSLQTDNALRHQQLVDELDNNGIEGIYCSQDEQRELIAALAINHEAFFGDLENHSFGHKGASITRNIAYLKLAQLSSTLADPLLFFIDSDQAFCIPGEEQPIYAIDYFHELDRLFSERDIVMLTGKVVGDPPVSPAVMAGNLLQDIAALLQQLKQLDPDTACSFHLSTKTIKDDAAYHDMADLFGFDHSTRAFHYPCPLQGPHSHADCLREFASRLNGFFDGEHPTRQTPYEPLEISKSLKPARTVYTGNYVFRPECLRDFIPFAPLKLRMAGPTLGRLMKARYGEQFVSANLPMLHKRTLQQSGEAECRVGISRSDTQVDLSREFINQYLGDVMLFSVQALTEHGYPDHPMDRHVIQETVTTTESELNDKYNQKLSNTEALLQQVYDQLHDHRSWWQAAEDRDTLQWFDSFLQNIRHNFNSSTAHHRLINSMQKKQPYLDRIITAIQRLPQDKQCWQALLQDAT